MIADSTGSSLEGSIPVGPIEPATNRGCSGVAYASQAARARRAAFDIELVHPVADAPFGEPSRRRLEGARLDDIAADGEERLVDAADDIGASQHEIVVAALEGDGRRSPPR